MKYGETLRQRSIPAWSHHNIDYDDIKYLIKERTTPGKGKTISVPGRGDEKLVELENTLFQILADQHQRIDLFVRSKTGEIRRRLDHVQKQLKQLSSRKITEAENRIPIGRLERYGKLENDVLKAGDEIRSLARFTGIQRTAFRKLLKKYKKWTGSQDLESRFRLEVLEDPKSFTKLDLGPLLDDYSATLLTIRNLYEDGLHQEPSRKRSKLLPSSSEQSSIDLLQAAIRSGSRVEFDAALSTVPLGENGSVANYFVHPDNVVELQVAMLQYMEYFTFRSRSNSTVSPSDDVDALAKEPAEESDYFMLVADNLDRFAHEQSAVTVNDREHLPGRPPQMAKASVRWNNDEQALLSARLTRNRTTSVPLKSKHIGTFFDRNAPLPRKSDVTFLNCDDDVAEVRKEILKDPQVRPLYQISGCRSRFTSINSGPNKLTLATLDTSISMQKADQDDMTAEISGFPFAVLQVRKEGPASADLISALEKSHLVERVRGFSLQYHALWQTCKPQGISPPFWMSMLSTDIRKLPPPALDRNGSLANSSSGSRSATQKSTSTNSLLGTTESTTVVETERPSSTNPPDTLENPPLKSFRKKRRRTQTKDSPDAQSRYWSEYDHPEDGEGEDTFVIYIDPNEKSTFDRIFDKIGNLFTSQSSEEESLLHPPGTPNDDDTSDEEEGVRHTSSYGTVAPPQHRSRGPRYRSAARQNLLFLPQLTTICLGASVAILALAYILATTSKHKYATEVDAGIIFAIACSLLFAVLGFIPLWSRRDVTWLSVGVAALVLVLDATFSGFLLARLLG